MDCAESCLWLRWLEPCCSRSNGLCNPITTCLLSSIKIFFFLFQVHFFNSFFYDKLRTKGYEGVKRWTKNVSECGQHTRSSLTLYQYAGIKQWGVSLELDDKRHSVLSLNYNVTQIYEGGLNNSDRSCRQLQLRTFWTSVAHFKRHDRLHTSGNRVSSA